MAEELHLIVNGRQVLPRVAPRLAGDVLMVPLRPVVENCGGTVEFVAGAPSRAQVQLGGQRAWFTVGEREATREGDALILPAPPVVWSDTLMVPAGALAALGVRAEFDEEGQACLCGCADPRLAGRRIFLDPGHGGRDPGAIGRAGTKESAVTLSLAGQTARLLGLAGAKPSLSRTTDRGVSLPMRVKMAQARRAEVFVCIHANSFTDPQAHGIETYYFETWEGQRLAAAVQQQLVEELGLSDRGVREAAYYVLRHAEVPACLTEVAFLSNPREEELLADPWFRLKAGLALFRGIRAFLDSAAARLS
ncbi:MAG TPA: hypothetical protein GXX28_08420 [Firmicutes bacterium]|nr:hypothetical protein [Bacillota bacterium]